MNKRFSNRSAIFLCFGVAIWLFVPGCNKEKNNLKTKANLEPTVVAGNYPLAFFVESLVGDEVNIIGPPKELLHPPSWNPDDDTIASMQNADLIFVVGADYDAWLVFTTLPERKIVDTSSKMYRDFLEIDGEVHKHGNDGKEHVHKGAANYFWLDPTMAKGQVEKIAANLIKAYPELGESIEANKNKLDVKLDELAREFDSIKTEDERVIFASDPRFAYLLRLANVEHVYFHWTDHGKEELPEGAWGKFDELSKEQKPMAMVFPFEPSDAIKQRLAERKVSLAVLDSIEAKDPNDDYFKRMKSNLQILKAIKEANSAVD